MEIYCYKIQIITLNNRQPVHFQLLKQSSKMCLSPCSTCTGTSFYQCSTCTQSAMTLVKSNLCLYQPNYIIQITCTALLFLFIIVPLMRKRSVVLIRIFDAIQIVAYFKYINGHLANRHNYLYLGMRSWGQWSEGWDLLTLQDDISVPVWINQQTIINKLIRIGVMWGGVIVLMILLGFIKTLMGDSDVTLGMYISKNLSLAFFIGFYLNVQDMAFVMANAYYTLMYTSDSFSNIYTIIQLCSGAVFFIATALIMIWMFSIINFDFNKHLQKTPQKIYPYVYMFLFSMDYDLFPTFELTKLPTQEKKIYRYSNLRVIDIIKKVSFSFLVIGYLYYSDENMLGQIYSILAFLIFFDIIWYVALPFDLSTEYLPFALCILTDLLVIVILFLPQIYSSQLVQLILCLMLFLLAVISVVIEFLSDVYKIIPVDLYETGLSIVIEDKQLLKEIEQRKRQQEEHQRKLNQMEAKNKKLMEQLQAQKTRKKSKDLRKQQSQQSLPNIQEEEDDKRRKQAETVENNQPYQGEQLLEKDSMNSEDLANLYKVDQHKRRKIYQFNKKANFIYSNKVQY